MRITISLADALRRFRNEAHVRVLWADALCINQKDNGERASQVQLMGLIYFKAHRVRIWLGQDDEPTYRACHAASLVKKFAHPYRSRLGITSRDVSEELLRQHKDSENLYWAALHRLLERAWFKRVWVVQELGLSRRATFYCGETQFTRDELYDFVLLLEHSKTGLLVSYDIDLRMLKLGRRYHQATWGSGRIELGSDPVEAETFLDILSTTRGLKYTDDRDTIYAFLGHPSAFKQHRLDDSPYHWYPQNYYDSRTAILVPSYETFNTFSKTCTDLAISAIQNRGIGLEVLAHVAHDDTTIAQNVPSWAPIWTMTKQAAHFHQYNVHYAASGVLRQIPPDIHIPIGGVCTSRLSLRALRLGTIRFATTEPGTLSVETLVETLFPERVAGAAYLKMHALDWPDATSRSRDSYNDWSALAMTLTAGLITTDVDLAPGPAEKHLTRHVHGMESYLRRYERGPPQIQSSEDDDIAEYFHMDLGRAAQSRVFYVTFNNRFGLAPMIAQEGDQVWLPLGTKMPFVLRPLSEAVYKILGQTYLHGLMHGEAIKNKTESAFRTIVLC